MPLFPESAIRYRLCILLTTISPARPVPKSINVVDIGTTASTLAQVVMSTRICPPLWSLTNKPNSPIYYGTEKGTSSNLTQ